MHMALESLPDSLQTLVYFHFVGSQIKMQQKKSGSRDFKKRQVVSLNVEERGEKICETQQSFQTIMAAHMEPTHSLTLIL